VLPRSASGVFRSSASRVFPNQQAGCVVGSNGEFHCSDYTPLTQLVRPSPDDELSSAPLSTSSTAATDSQSTAISGAVSADPLCQHMLENNGLSDSLSSVTVVRPEQGGRSQQHSPTSLIIEYDEPIGECVVWVQ